MKIKVREIIRKKSLPVFFGQLFFTIANLCFFPVSVKGQDNPAEIIQRAVRANRYVIGWSQKNPSSGTTASQSWTSGYHYATLYLFKSGSSHVPHVMISLENHNSPEEVTKLFDRARNQDQDKNPEILAENFGPGSSSILRKYTELYNRDGTPVGRPAYRADVYGEGWLLKVILYNRINESVVTDLMAGNIARSLAEDIFNLIKPAEIPGPPKIHSIQAKVQHLSRTSASITIITHIKYANPVGNPRPGDVLITLRINDQVVQLGPGSQGLSTTGYDIRTESVIKTEKTGLHSIRVNLLDRRYSTSANSSLNYEDRYSADFEINEPVAEVKGVSGIASVIRKNNITRKDGILYVRDSPVSQTGAKKDPEALSSAWLYDGDQVLLADLGGRVNVTEGHNIIFPEYSSIHLEWDGGVQGKAIYRPGRYTVGDGKFTIGITRGLSGEITNRWGRNLRDYQILFTQSARETAEGMSEDEYTDRHDYPNLVDWVLERLPAFSRELGTIKKYGVFSWHAGSTVWSDIQYLELNSVVFVRPDIDAGLNIYVFEGNPVLHGNSGTSSVNLKSGTMVTFKPGTPATTGSFNPGQLERYWEGIRYVSWDTPDPGAQKEQIVSSNINDPIQPLDLDLADKLMKQLLNETVPDITLTHANVQGLKFYEGGYDGITYGQRIYNSRFQSSSARLIWWEINLAYPQQEKRIDFSVEAFLYKPDGTILNRQVQNYFIEPSWTSSSHSMGFGGVDPGTWIPGRYLVEIYISGKKAGEGIFEITP